MVPLSEISVPMHYCDKSWKENNNSPQYSSLGRLAVWIWSIKEDDLSSFVPRVSCKHLYQKYAMVKVF